MGYVGLTQIDFRILAQFCGKIPRLYSVGDLVVVDKGEIVHAW